MEQIRDRQEWNRFLLGLPGAHLLQSWEWGAFKGSYGWVPERWAWRSPDGEPNAAALVLYRTAGRIFRIAYCPRGPVLDWAQAGLRTQVLDDLAAASQRQGAIFLKIDPAVQGRAGAAPPPSAGEALTREVLAGWREPGWIPSPEQVQFRNTFALDLTPSEDELLAGMKQKTRYNIRLAARRGVFVRRGSAADLETLYQMYAETSLRDGFVIRTPAYYRDAWGSFIEAGLAQPFLAEVEGLPVAAIIVFRFGDCAYYMYGMSTADHREKMPNHLLQWEAIRWARESGCLTYDFWGAPDRIDPADPMYGVYRFKEGFGAHFVETQGAWDYPIRRSMYRAYSTLMPLVLAAMRSRGMAQTRSRLA
jgi:peptidoglycan pentaglycine glycine transferase (the first glycine)